jgi:hypothetical protein
MSMQAAAARAVSQRVSHQPLQAHCNARPSAYRCSVRAPRTTMIALALWQSEIHVVNADGTGDTRLSAL